MSLGKLLFRTRHILLDFDGPMCAAFSALTSGEATAALVTQLASAGVHAPSEAYRADDPFTVLSYVNAVAPGHAAATEGALADLEVAAVRSAAATPGLPEMLKALQATGHSVTVVSNNSARAVHAFVQAQSLSTYIRAVVARTSPDSALLKPSPHLLQVAAKSLHADAGDCVLLGDSVTDIQAAQRAGARSIAFANKPHKHEPLASARPDALVHELSEVVDAL